ncbi:hypothetical protein AAEX28_00290 [Lentisphaerota bacterium WC36G]|nr:hypothetical protein LJT99_03170 [Lentisphaerae bacterium WC36]
MLLSWGYFVYLFVIYCNLRDFFFHNLSLIEQKEIINKSTKFQSVLVIEGSPFAKKIKKFTEKCNKILIEYDPEKGVKFIKIEHKMAVFVYWVFFVTFINVLL